MLGICSLNSFRPRGLVKMYETAGCAILRCVQGTEKCESERILSFRDGEKV